MPRASLSLSSPASLRSFLTSSTLRAIAAPLALVAVAACNEAETGRRGIVDFVPDDCGEVICDLDDRLAFGATTDVYLSGINGSYVDDLELVADTSAFAVIGREASAFPRFTIYGGAPGRGDLVAIDDDGDEVDYISISVVRIDELDVDVEGDSVSGPETLVGTSGQAITRYRVPAGGRVEVEVDALAGRYPVMGSFEYGVVVDPQVLAALTDRSEIRRGFFELRDAPRGDHDIIVTAPGGAYQTIRLSVQ
jgi:hypothetical protein